MEELHSILHKSVGFLLDSNSNVPFKSDEEYLEMLEAIFLLRNQLTMTRDMLQTNFITFIKWRQNTADLNTIVANLETVHIQLMAQMERRLVPTDETKGEAQESSKLFRPRIVRLCESLELTKKESDALGFIILHNCGINYPPPSQQYEKRGTLRNMAVLCGMNSVEVLNFLSPARKHIKDGLFQCEDDTFCLEFSSQTFKMSKEVLSALMGASLTAEEFLRIDKTALSAVLISEGFDPLHHTIREEDSSNTASRVGDTADSTASRVGDAEDVVGSDDEKSDLKESGEEDLPENAGNLFDLIKREMSKKSSEEITEKSSEIEKSPKNPSELGPYKDDLDYLRDHFEVISHRIKLQQTSMQTEDDHYSFLSNKKKPQNVTREFKNKERQALRKCEIRLEKTMAANGWIPRLERLVKIRNLNQFEKWVILSLIGVILSSEIRKTSNSSRVISFGKEALSVFLLLTIHCSTLHEQIAHRKYFYKSATLVKEDIIQVSEGHSNNRDLTCCNVTIDRRMIDYCVALDTEFGALVEGSRLYTPTVSIDRVILPPGTKRKILDSVSDMKRFTKLKKDLGMDEIVSYGNGVVLMFHGMSGTGKTMMANALAKHLGRKVLLVNFMSISKNSKDLESVFLVFREAKIQNALVFMDECEALFEKRDVRRDYTVNILLNAIEQYDDILILATNRPFDLDEAMYRRITLSVEFRAPSVHLREAIWAEHIPKKLKLHSSVDLAQLAMKYELTGGFIKNAVLSALKRSFSRNSEEIILEHDDLDAACQEQITGQLQLVGFEHRFVPKRSFSDVILSSANLELAGAAVEMDKAKKVLNGQWGFEEEGTTLLLIGPSGTGKSVCAEAISFACGRPLKVVSCAELMTSHRISKMTTRTDVFNDVVSGAIIVIEGAELFFSRSQAAPEALNYLCSRLDSFKGMVIMMATTVEGGGSVARLLEDSQSAVARRIEFILNFEHPSVSMRQCLWRTLIPKKVPLPGSMLSTQGEPGSISGTHDEPGSIPDTQERSGSIPDTAFRALAERFREFNGAVINRCIVRASAKAALQTSPSKRFLTERNLIESAEFERKRSDSSSRKLGMYQ
eukprot:198656_1